MSEISDFINHKQEITQILENLTQALVDKLVVNFENEGEQWRIELNSDDDDILIGDQGENLLAIQHLLRTLFHAKHPNNRTHFILDVAKYRTNRERFIINMLRDMAYQEVVLDGKNIIIRGLNSYERRLVHNSLSDYKGLATSSIGDGPNRKMVIRPTIGSVTGSIEDAKVIDIEKYEKEFRYDNNQPKSNS